MLSASTASAILAILAFRAISLPSAMAGLTSPGGAYFEIGHNSLFRGRFDPVVFPGQVSPHVHAVVGGNGFNPNMTYESLRQDSTCTTHSNQADMSNWWTPQIYYKDKNTGELSILQGADGETGSKTYWYNRLGDNNTLGLVDFPPNFRMIAGSPFRTWPPTNVAESQISFTCKFGSKPGEQSTWYSFPTQDACDGSSYRSQVFFPSCWDGYNVDAPDHHSHMAYPTGGDQGNCPPTHPYRLPSTFIETYFELAQDQPFYEGCFVSAQGDNSGYGYHADFFFGWETPPFTPGQPTQTSLLVQVLTQCPDMGGNSQSCDLLAKYNTDTVQCASKGLIPAEDIGRSAPLSQLPGYNSIWSVQNPLPGVNTSTPIKPAEVELATPPIPAGWERVSCVKDPSGGKALSATGTGDSVDDMTPSKCITQCATAGYTMAGIEFGLQCQCGNSINAGSTTYDNESDWYNVCTSECGGWPYYGYAFCGGGGAQTIYQFTGSGSPAAEGTDTWEPFPFSTQVPALVPSYSPDATPAAMPFTQRKDYTAGIPDVAPFTNAPQNFQAAAQTQPADSGAPSGTLGSSATASASPSIADGSSPTAPITNIASTITSDSSAIALGSPSAAAETSSSLTAVITNVASTVTNVDSPSDAGITGNTESAAGPDIATTTILAPAAITDVSNNLITGQGAVDPGASDSVPSDSKAASATTWDAAKPSAAACTSARSCKGRYCALVTSAA